jgi:hypothetical protein
MEVRIQDHYGQSTEPQTFTGTPSEIEAQLRAYFKGTVGHIPFGDIGEMVYALQRMTGIDIWISDPVPRRPKRPKTKLPIPTDPWLHEIDMPDGNL